MRSVRTTWPSESTITTLSRSGFRSVNWIGIRRYWQRQFGPSSFPTRVEKTGLFSSFRCSAKANAAAEPPSSAATTSAAATCARRASGDIPDEDEGFRVLAANRRPVELGVSAKRAVVARVRIVAPLRLETGERLELPLQRRGHVDEPVRDEPVRRGGAPLRRRSRGIGQDAPNGLPRCRARGDRDRVEERAVVEVHI